MRLVRYAVGVAALMLFVIAVNLALLNESSASPAVVWPLLGSIALSVLWLMLWLAGQAASGKLARPGLANSIVGSIFFLGALVLVYAFVARAELSWDLTQEGRRDLAPQTVLVLQSLTEPVEVVCFFVRAGDDRVRLAQEKTRRFLDRCGIHTDRLEVAFIDPQERPEQVQRYNAIGVQKSEVGSILLKSGPRQREIPLSDVNARLEERDFINALVNVTQKASPRVYFLLGHGGWDLQSEDPKQGGRNFVELLVRESYDVDVWALQPETPAVPADADVLVINGYTEDLREPEIEAINAFIDHGGRLMVLVNPLYQQRTALPSVERLRPFLSQKFGVDMPTNVLVSNETGGYQIAILPDFSIFPNYKPEMGENVEPFRGSYNATHPITRGMDKQVALNFVRSVESVDELPDGVTHRVLLRSTPGTWAETDIDAIMNRRPIQHEATEASGPNPIAVAVTMQSDVSVADGSRVREARAVIVGNAYLSGNEFMSYAGVQDFLLNSLGWLTEREDIAIRPTGGIEQPLLLTGRQERIVAWVASLAAVQCVALSGVAVFVWRRRYR